jgi:hypothetical protein
VCFILRVLPQRWQYLSFTASASYACDASCAGAARASQPCRFR